MNATQGSPLLHISLHFTLLNLWLFGGSDTDWLNDLWEF